MRSGCQCIQLFQVTHLDLCHQNYPSCARSWKSHTFSRNINSKKNYLLVGTKDIGTEFIYLLFCRNQINIFLIHSDPMQNYLSKMIVRLIVDWIKKYKKKIYFNLMSNKNLTTHCGNRTNSASMPHRIELNRTRSVVSADGTQQHWLWFKLFFSFQNLLTVDSSLWISIFLLFFVCYFHLRSHVES